MVYGQSSLSFGGLEVLWHNGVSSWNQRFHLRLSLLWLICNNTEKTLGKVDEVPKLELFSSIIGKSDAYHGKHNVYQDTLTMSYHPYTLPKNAYPLTIQHFQLKLIIFASKSGKQNAYRGKHDAYHDAPLGLYRHAKKHPHSGSAPLQNRLPLIKQHAIENRFIALYTSPPSSLLLHSTKNHCGNTHNKRRTR